VTYDLRLRVWRGDATGGDFADYTVPAEEGQVVLDAIHRLQATQANDLAVRWNCKAGKCGSCSAEINGKPRLMCMTRLSTFEPGETITVTPLRTFPVIRDLVTDVSFNFEKAREVPAFAPPTDNAGGKFRMAQVDVERSQEFRKCIECFLCQNVCHVIRDHEENKPAFAGPRFFIRYAELDMHPLDTQDRKRMAVDDEGLGFCNITKCCTEVCPEGIKITDNGIIPMKERAVDSRYDPAIFLGSKILRRTSQRTPVGPAARGGPSPIKRPSLPIPADEVAPSKVEAARSESSASAVSKVGSATASAASAVADTARNRNTLPAAGAAAGVGLLAWALRRSRRR
jgi:succinate dehydrogenase / fumarate reductase iron-sulfur subunit